MRRELLALVATSITEQLGLYFPDTMLPDLERGLTRSAQALGAGSAEELAVAIAADGISDRQYEVLSEHLTIGETYFFRHPKAFDALREVVLPELLADRPHNQPIAIWSAGCSNGAEAYSLALTCASMQAVVAKFDYNILATDLNGAALQAGRQAIYGRWSLRTSSEEYISHHFDPHGLNTYRLRAAHLRSVTFARDNLVQDGGHQIARTGLFDIVFCRNVLIYFSPEQQRVAAKKLVDSLREGGYLFVSPSEVGPEMFPDLVVRQIGGTFAFQKPRASDAAKLVAPLGEQRHKNSLRAATSDRILQPTLATTQPAAAGATNEVIRRSPRVTAVSTNLDQAKSLADSGKAQEARELLDTCVDGLRMSLDFHFTRATVLQELGEDAEAARALRRALYLDPDFVLAHFALANLEARSGDDAGAKRRMTTLRRILEKLPADHVIASSDGMTAGQFMELIK